MFIMHDTEDMEYIYYNHIERENSDIRLRRVLIEEEMGVAHNEKK